MSDATSEGEIPPALQHLLRGRDETPLPDGALVRYQLIGLAPGIGKNFRFVLFEDGRLFAAANTPEPPSRDGQIFNTALPDSPTAIISEEAVSRVEELLRSSGFAASPAFVGNEGVRDGSVVIVTARADDEVHEVWYQNASTELTDLLSGLYHEAAVEQPSLDDLFDQYVGTRAEDDG